MCVCVCVLLLHLLGLQCGFDHQPALCALCVLHLQHIVTQVFASHGHKAFLALQINRKKENNKNKCHFY